MYRDSLARPIAAPPRGGRSNSLPLALFLSSQVINSKQSNLWLTQETLRMVTARVLVVLSGSFTSQIETGPTLT